MKGNNLISQIAVIFCGLAILLIGMGIVSSIAVNTVASFIDIIPMTLALWFVARFLHIDHLIGHRGVRLYLSLIAVLTLIMLIYSVTFVFSPTGYYYTLGDTGIFNEHAWCHDSIAEISEHSFADIFRGGIEDMRLGKYESLFVYCSLMFRFGGDVLTHICIWRAFHLGIVVLLVLLIASKIGVTRHQSFLLIMVVCLFMPMMDTLFAYNHDSVGYAFVALGAYIFISCAGSNLRSLIALPFIVLLFYWFRRPYALIAICMYLWSIFYGKRKVIDKVLGILVAATLCIVFFATADVTSLLISDVAMDGYIEDASQAHAQRGIVNGLLVSILGYFPWTNLLHDTNWPYALFNCLQGVVDISLLCCVFAVCRGRSVKSLLSNPVLLIGALFLVSSFVYPGHLSYTSVSMPFFAVVIAGVDAKKLFRLYGASALFLFVAGMLWGVIR